MKMNMAHTPCAPCTEETEDSQSEEHEDDEDCISQQTVNRSMACKKYMEHFYMDFFKCIELRLQRKERLEKQLDEQKCTEKQRRDAMKQLYKRETEYMRLRRAKITAESFEPIKVIGRGAFGEVSLVRMFDTDEVYAMKKMKKHEMIKSNQVAHVRAERDLMCANKYKIKDNPWLVDLVYSFTDEDYLYLIMEYIPGGDLMTLLIRKGTLTEDEARFYLAETILAVESVHNLQYIHRDVKPDNLLIDETGHVKLSDFGLCIGLPNEPNLSLATQIANLRYIALNKSKSSCPEIANAMAQAAANAKGGGHANTNMPLTSSDEQGLLAAWKQVRREMAHSTVGTPDYIAPEALLQRGYHRGSDWWSVGIILYEMLFGFPPFCSENPCETYRKILNYKTTLQFPFHTIISPEAYDLITNLLCDDSERLDIDEIKAHPFFRDINWETLREQKAAFVPHISGPTDTSNFDYFEAENTDHKEDGHKSQEDYTISDKEVEYTMNMEYNDTLADAALCADYSLADLCADYSLSDLAGYKEKRTQARAPAGTQSCGGTPKTSSFREKLEKRYSVHDMHFAGYAFKSFDAVSLEPISEEEEVPVIYSRRKPRPRSTTF